MNIKKILAIILVVWIAYVTIYAYLHPDELVYRVDNNKFFESDIPKEPTIKENNPFVYYSLKLDWLVIIIGVLWWIIDFKRSKQTIKKFKQKYYKLSYKQ